MPEKDDRQYSCFIAISLLPEFHIVRRTIIDTVMESGFRPNYADESMIQRPLGSEIIVKISQSNIIIADITAASPNIFFEIGWGHAIGKLILLISKENNLSIPSDLAGFKVLQYKDSPEGLSILSNQISKFLEEFRLFPNKTSKFPVMMHTPPVTIDWELLPEREIENLCRELLTQMGFQQLNWETKIPWLDIVARLSKKDPDGYEYNELWAITIGKLTRLDDFVLFELEELFHKIAGDPYFFEKYFSQEKEASITFLVIDTHRDARKVLKSRKSLFTKESGYFRKNYRIRIWDQNYLTSLIHQYPQIEYKYFSDEGRIRSTTRKTYEELYKENVTLGNLQVELISKLEDEKNKRIRAERDAVWKDISFSAAHKIGNPIFAIETDMDPLLRRIRENRSTEAIEVVDNMRSSVEKAKAFVEQFKSLARAQEVNPVSTELLPILENSSHLLTNKDISMYIKCPEGLRVFVDPERIAEAFDELIANATHWFDKEEKKLEIIVIENISDSIPGFLDTSKPYVKVHVKDNGCGIIIENKQRIFDAFFTTYDHGTGLGLALVRRIIEGHGGGIVEKGIPGQGADFEIYLPTVPEKTQRHKPLLKPPSKKKQNNTIRE